MIVLGSSDSFTDFIFFLLLLILNILIAFEKREVTILWPDQEIDLN